MGISRRTFLAGSIGLALPDSVSSLMSRYQVPGAAIAVLRDGKMVENVPYGVKSTVSEEKVVADTVFEAASLSKPVFSYAVLWMAQRGELDLDKPLIDDVDRIEIAKDPRARQITARVVLSQSTGLPNWRPRDKALAIGFTPGTAFSYSGEAYVWLQRVVEKISGSSLEDFMRDRVLAPFGMRNSSYVWRPQFAFQAAEGHDTSGKPVRTRLWEWTPDKAPKLTPGVDVAINAIPNAAASLYTTASDYALFVSRVLANPPKGMLVPRTKVNDRIEWALGWGIQHTGQGDAFWQWGNNGVYQGFVLGYPADGRGMVILTNSQNGLKFCRDAVSLVLKGEQPAFSLPLVLPA
jgi:CubicO group peptidase (beta-lactamase class C family)